MHAARRRARPTGSGRPSPWDSAAGRRAHTTRWHASRPEEPPRARGGSTVGLSHWERWLEFCARIDGFPRHLSIHSGGMLVTAAPLIDIAPLEHATMPDRVVVQFDKRDVETLKLIKLDLLGLGMLAAIDETLQLIEHDCAVCLDLDRLPEEIGEVFDDAPGGRHGRRLPGREPGPDADAAASRSRRASTTSWSRSRSSGRARSRATPSTRTCGASRVSSRSPTSTRSLEPVLKDTLGVILYQEQVMRIAIEVAGFSPAESDGFRRAMGTWRSSREMEKLHAQFVEGALRQPGMTEDDAEELFRQVAAFAVVRVRQEPRRGLRADGLRIVVPQAVLPGPVPGRAHQRPADGLLPGRGPRQRHEAPRRGGAARGHQRVVVQDDDRVGRAGRAAGRRSSRRAASSRRRPSRERWTPAHDRRLGRAARAAPREGDRRAARGAPRRRAGTRRRTGAWSMSSSGPTCPRRCSNGSSGAGRWTRSAGRGASCCGRLREVAGASRGRMDGRTVRALGTGGRQARRGRRSADGPAPAGDRRAGAPRDHRVGADR